MGISNDFTCNVGTGDARQVVFGVRHLTLGSFGPLCRALLHHGMIQVVCLTVSRPARLFLWLLHRFIGDRLQLNCYGMYPWYSSPTIFTDQEGRNIRFRADAMIMNVISAAVRDGGQGKIFDTVFGRSAGLEKVYRLYYEIMLFSEIREHLFVGFALHAAQLRGEFCCDAKMTLLVPSRWWFSVFKKEVAGLSIEAKSVFHCLDLRYLHEIMNLYLYKTRVSLKKLFRLSRRGGAVLKRILAFGDKESLDNSSSESPVDHIRFSYDSLSVDGERLARESGVNVATILYDGIEPSERSNIKWYWERDTNRDGLYIVAFADTVQISPKSLETLRGNGTHVCYDKAFRGSATDQETWSPCDANIEKLIAQEKQQLLTSILRSIIPCNSSLRWFVSKYLNLIFHQAWWSDYFESNQIRIFIEDYYDRDAVARYLALHFLGGVTIASERSQEFDQGHILSERFADVYFMAGGYGLKQSQRPELRKHILMTGFPLDTVPISLLSGDVAEVREKLSPSLPLILMVDEGGLRFGREHVFSFYKALLEDLDASNGYRLMIKSKKLLILKEAFLRNEVLMKRLIENGKLLFLDFDCSASVGAVVSDICISLPSTAMFDPMILGKPTAVYNPGRAMHTVFYEQGLDGIVVFDDLAKLLEAFHSHLSGQFPGFGDASEFVKEIDPFGDGLSSFRMSHAIEFLRDALSGGATREDAIKDLLRDYRSHWGVEAAGSWDQYMDGVSKGQLTVPDCLRENRPGE